MTEKNCRNCHHATYREPFYGSHYEPPEEGGWYCDLDKTFAPEGQMPDDWECKFWMPPAPPAFCPSHGEYDIRMEDGDCPACLAIASDWCAGAYN